MGTGPLIWKGTGSVLKMFCSVNIGNGMLLMLPTGVAGTGWGFGESPALPIPPVERMLTKLWAPKDTGVERTKGGGTLPSEMTLLVGAQPPLMVVRVKVVSQPGPTRGSLILEPTCLAPLGVRIIGVPMECKTV